MSSPPPAAVLAGRYALGDVIGRGGAATVHLGKRTSAPSAEPVAIKRLHPHLAADPAFLAMMLDEARLLSRVRHPNVVATLDVVLDAPAGELFIVMEYVPGLTLGALLARAHQRDLRVPPPVASAIVRDALLGLHAAHEATGPGGEPLGMVHRDVSPQNLLVSESGSLKVVDFGIAKAEGRVQLTLDGSIKGKLGYMPPEQLFGDALDRRADVYAAGVLLWEALAGERLFAGEHDAPALMKSLVTSVPLPSARVPGLDPAVDRVVTRALSHTPASRFDTAAAMAAALTEALPPASPSEVAAWMRSLAPDLLSERASRVSTFLGAPPPRRRPWLLPAAALSTLTLAAAAATALSLRAPAPESATLPNSASPQSLVGEDLPTSAPLQPRGDLPAPPGTPPSPSGSPSALAPSTPLPPPADSGAPSTKGPPRPAPKAAPKGACDPPFVIDTQGHKRYKRECLR